MLHRLPSCLAPRMIRHHAVPDWIETSRADCRAVIGDYASRFYAVSPLTERVPTYIGEYTLPC